MSSLNCISLRVGPFVQGHRAVRLISILLGSMLLGEASAQTASADEAAPAFELLPYVVDESLLPFSPLPGAKAVWGISERGAGYQIETPEKWNGSLMVYLRGNGVLCEPDAGVGCSLVIEPNPLRRHAIERGFAWATTSYSDFRLFPGDHADDVAELVEIFSRQVSEPARSYVWGISFGGVTTLTVIERYPQLFDGAMPVCTGVPEDGFRSFFDVNFAAMGLVADRDEVVASFLEGFSFPFDAETYREEIAPRVIDALGENYPRESNALGEKLRNVVRENSGGPRPLFDAGFDSSIVNMITNYMEIAKPIDGGSRVPIGNQNVTFRFETKDDELLTDAEKALNARIPRFECDTAICRASNRPSTSPGLAGGIIVLTGDINIPVLNLQNIGDLTAPLAGAITYSMRVRARAKSTRLVQRAIRSAHHCEFHESELVEGFDDLTDWVETYKRPKGDNLASPEVVAAPDFGCAFTREKHRLDRSFEADCGNGDSAR